MKFIHKAYEYYFFLFKLHYFPQVDHMILNLLFCALSNYFLFVQAEVKEDITAEEAFENKKLKIAELGTALLSDPESNIKSLKDFLQLCKDDDQSIVKLGLLSLSAVFKDIIPG